MIKIHCIKNKNSKRFNEKKGITLVTHPMAIKLFKKCRPGYLMSYRRKKLHIKEREKLKSLCHQSKVLFFPRDVTILTTCLTTFQLTLYPRQMISGRWARPCRDQECLVMRTPLPLFTPKPHVSTLQMEQEPLILLFVPPQAILPNKIFYLFCVVI